MQILMIRRRGLAQNQDPQGEDRRGGKEENQRRQLQAENQTYGTHETEKSAKTASTEQAKS